MSAEFPDDSDLIEAVLESRDEFGYPDMNSAVEFLDQDGIKFESMRLLIVFEGVQARNSKRRMQESDREVRRANRLLALLFLSCALLMAALVAWRKA